MTRMMARALALLGAAVLAACNQTPDYDIVIRDVNAWDAQNGLREGVDVAITGDKIVAVGEDLASADGAREIDGTGKYLIPGLWDAHVHIAFNDAVGHEIFFPLSIAHGVTSLRDTGGHLDQLADARDAAGTATTPDLYIAGPLLDGSQRVYDGSSATFVDISVGLATPEEARAKVDELADAGVHFLKAYEMLDPEVFAAIADQAKVHGLPVTAHVPLSITADAIGPLGVTDLQHLRNLELACVADPASLEAQRRAMLAAGPDGVGADSNAGLRSAILAAQRAPAIAMQDEEACAALIASFAAAQVFQTPTARINSLLYSQWFNAPEWTETFAMLPKDLREDWTATTSGIAKRAPSEDGLAFAAWSREMTMRLAQADVPLMAGTDAPIAFFTPGIGLHAELATLVENGLTPQQALEAATLSPARWFGLEAERGTIAKDMAADLVLLSANPLEEITHTRAIAAVAKDGTWHDRAALDTMLAGVRGD